jgi:nitrous-oxide reductase
MTIKFVQVTLIISLIIGLNQSCKPKNSSDVASGDAEKAYVAPGKYDEFYNFVSGGFSGQISVYGLPSGRLFRVIAKKLNQC